MVVVMRRGIDSGSVCGTQGTPDRVKSTMGNNEQREEEK
jgi:hypothetical protein